ncbi:hypothetical protein [Nocardioides stalactiti]|uniref:hypothetical protein n=1 Tax=Nocardioides stalactiti TaxID=2755356 RepID=UPI0016012D0E|nr:hypothetical protein [Nocardioides stalactiti]
MDAMEELLDSDGEQPGPTDSIPAFIDAALARFPELDDDSGPECPWASAPLAADAVGDIIYFSMTFSGAGLARDELADIASALGLICYDPQIEQMLPDPASVPASTVSQAAYAALAEHLHAEEQPRESGWLARLFKRT